LCVCAKGEHFKPYIDKQQSSWFFNEDCLLLQFHDYNKQ
jgi:hypothetical protein